MKNLILILTIIFAISIANEATSQDIIILQNGDEILSKITKVDLDKIEYKKFENLEGPIYILDKSKVFMIKYENGTKDIFKEKQSSSVSNEIEKENSLEKIELKEEEDNFDIVVGGNIGASTMQGSSVEKVYGNGENHFRIMGGTRIKNTTLLLFYERTSSLGHPLDENMNQYSNINCKLNMKIIGVQANFGKVDNLFYFGPRLANVTAKESFDFMREIAEAEVNGMMIGAIAGFRTRKRFQVFGEINLDYFSFNTEHLTEEALAQEEGGFIRLGFNAGIRFKI
jgi:hypothetical protein